MKVLLIEDERKTAQELAKGLGLEGYEVALAHSGEEGLKRLASEAFDLVVLDWMLPERDGLDVLQTIRRDGSRLPVILLTAKDGLEDRVAGLDAGADDYLVKPFAFAELLARLRALVRRAEKTLPALRVGDLEVDLIKREVRRAGREIPLTETELNLLVYLMRHEGQIVTRKMLAADVWKEQHRATPLDNVIDVHMAHLRKKVDLPFDAQSIQTVRGVGFRIICGEKQS